ncbi:MAG: T9SS type A sorting domain-containing protein, partial [Bacteroidota bacterium]
GGQTRDYIAALDSVSPGNATSWNPTANTYVNVLAVSGTTVYAGGYFITIGGQTRHYIAALDATTNTNNATTWNPTANSNVNALAVSGSTVYVGGNFSTIGGQTRDYIAALDSVSPGNATSWNPNASSTVYSLAASGSTVYAGGSFGSIGGQTRVNIAAINTSTGIVTSWNPSSELGGQVFALAVSGSTIYAAGNFNSIGGQSRNNIAALDATTGSATSWNPSANNAVNALTISGSTIYVGGNFTAIGGHTRDYIAALDATTNTNNATSWNPTANGFVTALALSDSIVYAGGEFTTIGGQTRDYIAALDSVSPGNATSWNPTASPSGTVYAFAISDSTIYVGGAFYSIGGVFRNYIAALDATTGIPTSWNPNATNSIKALALSGSTIYAGGQFTSIGGQNRNYIAALDTSTGNATSWNPNASGGVVQAMALDNANNTVYFGGDFTAVANTFSTYLAGVTNPGDVDLPVELTSFTVTSSNSTAILAWKTATEVNNAGFDIERRLVSSEQWTKIGTVPGAGTSNSPHTYSYTDKIETAGTYSYRLKQVDHNGAFVYSQAVQVTVAAPKVLALSQNYPEPFNPSTTIQFTLPSDGHATLKVYNVLGQEVATLFNGEATAGSNHQVQFDASNLSSGIYFSRLDFGGRMQVKKMLLLK